MIPYVGLIVHAQCYEDNVAQWPDSLAAIVTRVRGSGGVPDLDLTVFVPANIPCPVIAMAHTIVEPRNGWFWSWPREPIA